MANYGPVVQLQRFCYKCCELRKGNVLGRRKWLDEWSSMDMRLEFLQRHNQPFAWPYFGREDIVTMTGDAWTKHVLSHAAGGLKQTSKKRLRSKTPGNIAPGGGTRRPNAKSKFAKKRTHHRQTTGATAAARDARLLENPRPPCTRCKLTLSVRGHIISLARILLVVEASSFLCL